MLTLAGRTNGKTLWKEIDVYKVLRRQESEACPSRPAFRRRLSSPYHTRAGGERDSGEIRRHGGIAFVRAALGYMNVRYHSVGMGG